MAKEILFEKTVGINCYVIKYRVEYKVVVEYDENGMEVYLKADMRHDNMKTNHSLITKHSLPTGYSLFHLHPIKPSSQIISYQASLPHVRRDNVSDLSNAGAEGHNRNSCRFTSGQLQVKMGRWHTREFPSSIECSVYPGYDEGGQREHTTPEKLAGDVAWLLDYMEKSIVYLQEVGGELHDMYVKLVSDGAERVSTAAKAVDGVRDIINALRNAERN